MGWGEVSMEKKWAGLPPEQKQGERFKALLSPPGVKFASPEAEGLYQERVTRLSPPETGSTVNR